MASTMYNIDRDLVDSIVQTESSFNPFAARYEAGTEEYCIEVQMFSKKNGLSPITESIFQKTSFGLMQVMGFKAREMGHQTSLLELCIPDIGLSYGCQFLARLLKKYGNEQHAIAAYNAGSARFKKTGEFVNQDYVNKVMTHLNNRRKHNATH